MWQRLHEELSGKGLVVVSVALESGGAETARPWVERANPTYPCLVDEHHRVAELFGIVNVPEAVWIDEDGVVVRGPEPAGSTDAFRQMDPVDYTIPDEARDELRTVRARYLDAIRDWADKGAASRFVANAKREVPGSEHFEALVRFSLGQHLYKRGNTGEGRRLMDEALALAPKSWAIRRQAWALEDPAKSGGKEFWEAVAALGDGRYYPEIDFGDERDATAT